MPYYHHHTDWSETYRVGKFWGGVTYEEDAQNPRKEWDNMGHMVCWHSRYDLGDEQPSENPEEYLWNLVAQNSTALSILKSYARKQDRIARVQGLARTSRNDYYSSEITDWATEYDLSPTWLLHKAGWLILPLYLYDHGGITMNTTGFYCPWDSGQVGYIYLTPTEIAAEYGDTSPESYERARKYLIGEVETYDQYLTGDVHCIFYGELTDEVHAALEAGEMDDDDVDVHEHLVDYECVCGCYGRNYAEEEMRTEVDYMVRYALETVAA